MEYKLATSTWDDLEINAIHKRKYPVLEVGDYVRVYRKRKVGEKERTGVWENGKTNITKITESFG